MGLYDKFKTSSRLEAEGVTLELPEMARILLARAGGENVKYVKALEGVARKNKHLFAGDVLSSKQGAKLLQEVYAEHVILSWDSWNETSKDWVEGIEGPDGTLMETTFDNIMLTFEALPELWLTINNFANDRANYLESHLKAVIKN